MSISTSAWPRVEQYPTIVQFLTRMLNDFNPLVQKFSMDQQRLFSPYTAKVAIRLDGHDGILYNLLMHFASRKSSGLSRPFDVYMQLILELFVIKMVGLWFSVYLGSQL